MHPARRSLVLLLAILLGVLALADVFLTRWILGQGGVELNRWMAPFAGNPLCFLGVKSLVLIAILSLALLARPLHQDADTLILLTACGMAIQPVVWNTTLLLLSP